MKEMKKSAEGANFTAVDLGNLDQMSEYGFVHPVSGQTIQGKAFLKDVTKATGTEISFSVLPPHTDLPFFHTHNKNEETYLILSGAGKFQVDDACFDISEGSVVRVAPAGKRGMANTSDAAMTYVVIQSKQGSLEEYTSEDGEIMQGDPLWKK